MPRSPSRLRALSAVPGPGTQDICLVTASPIQTVLDHLKHAGVSVVERPVPRTGATGPIVSVYVRDPDGNLIELARCVDSGAAD